METAAVPLSLPLQEREVEVEVEVVRESSGDATVVSNLKRKERVDDTVGVGGEGSIEDVLVTTDSTNTSEAPSKRAKLLPATPESLYDGGRGVLMTCNRNIERRAIQEAVNLFNEVWKSMSVCV